MMSTVGYAVYLITTGAESAAEDDLNENGYVAEENHVAACDLAIRLVHAIRDNPESFLRWAKPLIEI